jgi:adenylate kinase
MNLDTATYNNEQSRIVLIVFGPPGAGKGTQCNRLAHALQVPHISTGDLLREQVLHRTALGRQAKEAMVQGVLLADSLVFDMLARRVAEADCARGFILDGFPRTLEQAELLERHLSGPSLNREDRRLTLIMARLVVGNALLLRRLSGRRICPVCASIFNLHTQPPRLEGLCDRDGSLLVVRDDDRNETIVERLRLYERQALPIVRHYAQHAALLQVDGERPVESVTAETLRAIRDVLRKARQAREVSSEAETQSESP